MEETGEGLHNESRTVVVARRSAWDKVPSPRPRPAVQCDLHDQRDREHQARLRKTITTEEHFPSDDAATKQIWLALRNITPTGRRGT